MPLPLLPGSTCPNPAHTAAPRPAAPHCALGCSAGATDERLLALLAGEGVPSFLVPGANVSSTAARWGSHAFHQMVSDVPASAVLRVLLVLRVLRLCHLCIWHGGSSLWERRMPTACPAELAARAVCSRPTTARRPQQC